VTLRIAAVCVLAALASSGCQTDPGFARARAAGTAEAYGDFIDSNPNSPLRPQAEKALSDALWREAVQAGRPSAYISFLKAVPDVDARTEQAREACRGLLIAGKGTEDEALSYLRFFPHDGSADRIRRALAKVRLDALKNSPGPWGASLFTALYPGTPEAASLAAAVRLQEFKRAEKVGTRLAYSYFLTRYPSSAESQRAKERLTALSPADLQTGEKGDLDLISRLRAAVPQFARLECRQGLAGALARERDQYGSEAERLRARLLGLSRSETLPDFCGERVLQVPARERALVSGAVRALARIKQRQKALGALLVDPEKLTAEAREIGRKASALADESETLDLELEALYGNTAADPRRPDDTAPRNAREAMRRAKRGYDAAQALGDSARKAAFVDLLGSMDRQSDLLLEIIASREVPAAAEAAE